MLYPVKQGYSNLHGMPWAVTPLPTPISSYLIIPQANEKYQLNSENLLDNNCQP